MEERRKFIRIKKAFTVKHRMSSTLLGGVCLYEDISAGGLRLPIFQRLEPGMSLELDISLGELTEFIPALGRIVWVNEQFDARLPFVAGVEFVEIERVDRNKIISCVANHLVKNDNFNKRSQ